MNVILILHLFSVARFVQKYDLLTMKNLHLRILRNSGKVLHLAGSSRIRLGGGGYLNFEGVVNFRDLLVYVSLQSY